MKVAVTGRPGVGKTALVYHASRGDWIGELPETLGTAVMRVEREDGRAYELWDVGARHAARHPDAVDAQLAGADVLVHVFSFADAASLRSAPEYLERVRARGVPRRARRCQEGCHRGCTDIRRGREGDGGEVRGAAGVRGQPSAGDV